MHLRLIPLTVIRFEARFWAVVISLAFAMAMEACHPTESVPLEKNLAGVHHS